MTDREKLVNILKSQPYGYHTYDEMADYLLANGVTVQRMIPIMEEVPSEDCLAVNDCGMYMVGRIIKDPYSSPLTGYTCMFEDYGIADITHWMSLPKPPKEESNNDWLRKTG